MNHRNVSTTPSENASTPNSPASSIHNLNSPVSSPTAAHNAANNATSVQINSNLANSMNHNMNLSSNDNHPSQNSAMLHNKTDFNLINESHMIANQMNPGEGSVQSAKESRADDDEYLQLQGTFTLDELPVSGRLLAVASVFGETFSHRNEEPLDENRSNFLFFLAVEREQQLQRERS